LFVRLHIIMAAAIISISCAFVISLCVISFVIIVLKNMMIIITSLAAPV